MPAPVQTQTPDEIIARALEDLGELGLGIAPNAEHVRSATQKLRELYNEWQVRGWALWDFGATPPEAAYAVSQALAARLGRSFGAFDHAEAQARELAAERSFLRTNHHPASWRPVKATYF